MSRLSPWLMIVAAVCLTAAPQRAEARANYPALIPNDFDCLTCHTSSAGGGGRNSFGADFGANGRTWAAVFDLDSDGDGFTNGEELGDPEGLWAPGDPDPDVIATEPGDRSSAPVEVGCGNGVLEEGEDCDADDLGEASCASQGFEAGTIRCTESCRFDTSACRLCGNGLREEGEQCDGFDVGGQACNLRGFDQGRVVCTPDCLIDDSACTACGDGVREGEEECDGDDFGEATCASIEPASIGSLSCGEGCTVDDSGCGPLPPDSEPEVSDEAPAPEAEAPPADGGGCSVPRNHERPLGWPVWATVLGLLAVSRKLRGSRHR